jgi:hypothetical protein
LPAASSQHVGVVMLGMGKPGPSVKVGVHRDCDLEMLLGGLPITHETCQHSKESRGRSAADRGDADGDIDSTIW